MSKLNSKRLAMAIKETSQDIRYLKSLFRRKTRRVPTGSMYTKKDGTRAEVFQTEVAVPGRQATTRELHDLAQKKTKVTQLCMLRAISRGRAHAPHLLNAKTIDAIAAWWRTFEMTPSELNLEYVRRLEAQQRARRIETEEVTAPLLALTAKVGVV